MPKNTPCDHKRCDGGPCRQLTDEELTPGKKDWDFAQGLIDEGFLSISTKHRRVARLTDKYPTAEDLIKPEKLKTPEGEKLARLWDADRAHVMRCKASGAHVPEDFVEVKELTLKQFRAFKKLGGAMA